MHLVRFWIMMPCDVVTISSMVSRRLVGVWIGGVWHGHFHIPNMIFQRPTRSPTEIFLSWSQFFLFGGRGVLQPWYCDTARCEATEKHLKFCCGSRCSLWSIDICVSQVWRSTVKHLWRKIGTTPEIPRKRSQSKFWISRFRTVGDPQTLEN